MKTIFLVVGVFLFLFAEITNASGTKAAGKIVGLIEIPKIFGSTDANGPPGQKKPAQPSMLEWRAEPNANAKVASRVSSGAELTARERGSEELTAVVFDRKEGWSLVETKCGKAWLAPADAGRYRSYEELIESGPSYLKKSWDGKLWSSFDGAKTCELLQKQDKVDVRILSKKRVAGRIWFEIQLIAGRFEGIVKPGKKACVPAFDEKSANNFWLYSRGC